MRDSPPETVSLRELTAAVWRGRLLLGLGPVLGVVVALVVSWTLPPRYEAVATVVLRDRTESSSTGGLALPGIGSGLEGLFSLPGRLGGGIDTEIEILTSRNLIRRMAIQVGLPVTVLRPRGVPADSVFASVEVTGSLGKRGVYRFRGEGSSYRVTGSYGVDQVVAPGGRIEVPGAVLTLRSTPLPVSFKVAVADLEETLDRIIRRNILEASEVAGDIAEVRYAGRDRWTAAKAANTLIALYLRDRQQRRSLLQSEREAMLSHVADSLALELSRAVDSYRRHQESRAAFDPDRLGDVERVMLLRTQADALRVEFGAVEKLLAGARGDAVALAGLLGSPSLTQNEALRSLLDRLHETQAERASLLEWRTEQDSEVRALDRSIAFFTAELGTMAAAHRDALRERLGETGVELERYRDALRARPAEEAEDFALEQEVERLTATSVGVQAQLVQARLGAIGEGWDLRQVDVAVPPRRPEFPRLPLNMLLGFIAGSVFGLAGALLRGTMTNRIFDVGQLRAVTHVPVFSTDSSGSLLLAGASEIGSVLVLPVGEPASAQRAARWLAEAMALSSGRASLLDLANRVSFPMSLSPEHVRVLEGPGTTAYQELIAEDAGDGNAALVPPGWARSVGELERQQGPIVIAAPGVHAPVTRTLLDRERPVILSVERGEPALSDIEESAETLERLGFSVVGIVLTGS